MANINPHYRPKLNMPGMQQFPAPAPGSSVYNAPAQQPEVTSMDPRAPLAAYGKAKGEYDQAGMEMEQASQVPTSGRRTLAGGLMGALGGFISGAQAGAQMGQGVINAPREQAMSFAQRRAERAKAGMESAKTEVDMTSKVRSDDISEMNSLNQKEAQDAQARSAEAQLKQRQAEFEREGQQVFNPENIGGRMVSAPVYAGGPTLDHGPAAPPAGSQNITYRVDDKGFVVAVRPNPEGGTVSEYVPNPEGTGPLQGNPPDASSLDKYLTAVKNGDTKTARDILDFQRASAIGQQGMRLGEAEDVAGLVANAQKRYPALATLREARDRAGYQNKVAEIIVDMNQSIPGAARYAAEVQRQLMLLAPQQAPAAGNSLLQGILNPPAGAPAAPAAPTPNAR